MSILTHFGLFFSFSSLLFTFQGIRLDSSTNAKCQFLRNIAIFPKVALWIFSHRSLTTHVDMSSALALLALGHAVRYAAPALHSAFATVVGIAPQGGLALVASLASH